LRRGGSTARSGIQAVTGSGEKDGVKLHIDLDKAVIATVSTAPTTFEASLRIDGDVWVINASRAAKAGDVYPGGEIEIRVDAANGTVISVIERH